MDGKALEMIPEVRLRPTEILVLLALVEFDEYFGIDAALITRQSMQERIIPRFRGYLFDDSFMIIHKVFPETSKQVDSLNERHSFNAWIQIPTCLSR